MIESISAVTLATHDMARAARFYRTLGFALAHGGDEAAFTSFRVGKGYLNLVAQPPDRRWTWWGRVIFHVSDVDALYAQAIAAGHPPRSGAPRCRMGRALLPSDRSGWPRAELRAAAAGEEGGASLEGE
jgi:catechol 2,3-dioxygenase-like lactoylglutathione lyase family enzyme